jgi:hypothetical protein
MVIIPIKVTVDEEPILVAKCLFLFSIAPLVRVIAISIDRALFIKLHPSIFPQTITQIDK